MLKPLILMILDGWGERAANPSNAISEAHTPHWDWLSQHAVCGTLVGSGHAVGLPEGQMGNSEVGHMTIGLGRAVQQDLTKIHDTIAEGTLGDNAQLQKLIQLAKSGHKLHIMGLLSPGGVHSHEEHWFAILDLLAAQGIDQVACHPMLDGRDTPPVSAAGALTALEKHLLPFKSGKIASLIGRYYAMDRDARFERTEAAYQLLVEGQAVHHAATAIAGLELAYAAGETDEFVKATSIHTADEKPIVIEKDDLVLFMNFRADRARALTAAFINPTFDAFKRPFCLDNTHFFTLTAYAHDLSTQVLFPPTSLENSLAVCLAKHGLTQLRLAETEKYAHVTFFFNGGSETSVVHENRLLIPSPKVATYDLQPEMSAPAITDALVEAIAAKRYDFIVVNYANADMVGHTGDLQATIKAITCIDTCLGRVLTAIKQYGGELLLTADHGNAECMQDPITKQPHTAHTNDPVPLRYLGRPAILQPGEHTLADLAPTLLTLLGLPVPDEMTGHSLLILKE